MATAESWPREQPEQDDERPFESGMLREVGKHSRKVDMKRGIERSGVLTPGQAMKAAETPDTVEDAMSDITEMEKGRAAKEGVAFREMKSGLKAVPERDEEWEQITKEREDGPEARMKRYKEEAKAAVKKSKEQKDKRAMEQFGGQLPKSKKVSGESVTIFDNPPEELKQEYEQPSVIIDDAATVDAMDAMRQDGLAEAERIAAEKEKIYEDLKARDDAGETGLDGQLDAAAREMSDAQIAVMEARERAPERDRDMEEIAKLQETIRTGAEAREEAVTIKDKAKKLDEAKEDAAMIWGAAKKLDEEVREKMESAWYEAGEDPENALKSELAAVNMDMERTQQEWKDMEVQLGKMGVDPDRPGKLFGRLGFGLRKMFNPSLRKLHSEYTAKVNAWNEAMARSQEIKSALGMDEKSGAPTLRRKARRGRRNDTPPTAKTSIRGENL